MIKLLEEGGTTITYRLLAAFRQWPLFTRWLLSPNYQFATININGMSAPFYKLELGGAFGVPPEREGTEMPSPARRSYPLSE
jgi:hypothetical protein